MSRNQVSRRDFLRLTTAAAGSLALPGWALRTAAQETDLPGPEAANIDWRQFEGTEVHWLGFVHPFAVAVENMLPEFEALTGITVTMENVAWEVYLQKLTLDLGSPEPQYDCYLGNGYHFYWTYGQSGSVATVDEFLEDSAITDLDWYDLDDIDPKLMAAAKWDGIAGHKVGAGSQFTIPFMSEAKVLAYRDDLFQKYDLEVPTTVEEVLPAAKAIYEGEGIAGFAIRGSANPFVDLLANYGVTDFDEGMNSQLASEASVQYHDFIINQIIKPYGPAGWPGSTWNDLRVKFAAGQFGMYFDVDYFANIYEDPTQSQMAGKLKYANLGSADSKYVDYYYFGTAINEASQNKKAAWLLAEFLTSKKAMRDVTVNFRNLMPTRFSTFSDPGFVEMVGDWGGGTWLEATRANLDHWGVGLLTPTDQEVTVQNAWSGGITKIYEGAPVTDTLVETADAINAIMDRAGQRS